MTTVASGRCTSAPVPVADRHRHEAKRDHQSRHQYRTQPRQRSFTHSVVERQTLLPKRSDKSDHDQAVQDDHTGQGDEANGGRNGHRDLPQPRYRRRQDLGSPGPANSRGRDAPDAARPLLSLAANSCPRRPRRFAWAATARARERRRAASAHDLGFGRNQAGFGQRGRAAL